MMNKNKHKDKYPKLTSDITSKFELYSNKTSDMNELYEMAPLEKYGVVRNGKKNFEK